MYQIKGIQAELNRAGYWRQRKETAAEAEQTALHEIDRMRRNEIHKTDSIQITDTVKAERFRVSPDSLTAFYRVLLPVHILPFSDYDQTGRYNRQLIIILEIDERGVYQYIAFVTWADVKIAPDAKAILDTELMSAAPGILRSLGNRLNRFTDRDLIRNLYEFAVSYLKDWEQDENQKREPLIIRHNAQKSG